MIRELAFSVCLLVAGLVADAASVRAAELLMFEDPSCVWCRRWHAEIGPSYPNTAEGRRAPLRRVHIRDQGLAGVTLAARVTGTPTFVVAENGVEIGRIAGYPGAVTSSTRCWPGSSSGCRRSTRPSFRPGKT